MSGKMVTTMTTECDWIEVMERTGVLTPSFFVTYGDYDPAKHIKLRVITHAIGVRVRSKDFTVKGEWEVFTDREAAWDRRVELASAIADGTL